MPGRPNQGRAEADGDDVPALRGTRDNGSAPSALSLQNLIGSLMLPAALTLAQGCQAHSGRPCKWLLERTRRLIKAKRESSVEAAMCVARELLMLLDDDGVCTVPALQHTGIGEQQLFAVVKAAAKELASLSVADTRYPMELLEPGVLERVALLAFAPSSVTKLVGLACSQATWPQRVLDERGDWAVRMLAVYRLEEASSDQVSRTGWTALAHCMLRCTQADKTQDYGILCVALALQTPPMPTAAQVNMILADGLAAFVVREAASGPRNGVEIMPSAVWLVKHLVTHGDDGTRRRLVDAGALPALMNALRDGADADNRRNASLALCGLTTAPAAAQLLLDLGALPPLMHMLFRGGGEATLSLAVMNADALLEAAVPRLERQRWAVPLVVSALRNTRQPQKQLAACLLAALVDSSKTKVAVALAAGAAPLARGLLASLDPLAPNGHTYNYHWFGSLRLLEVLGAADQSSIPNLLAALDSNNVETVQVLALELLCQLSQQPAMLPHLLRNGAGAALTGRLVSGFSQATLPDTEAYLLGMLKMAGALRRVCAVVPKAGGAAATASVAAMVKEGLPVVVLGVLSSERQPAMAAEGAAMLPLLLRSRRFWSYLPMADWADPIKDLMRAGLDCAGNVDAMRLIVGAFSELYSRNCRGNIADPVAQSMVQRGLAAVLARALSRQCTAGGCVGEIIELLQAFKPAWEKKDRNVIYHALDTVLEPGLAERAGVERRLVEELKAQYSEQSTHPRTR